MQQIIEPLQTNHGILFLHQGTVINAIDSWNLVTTFDTTILWKRLNTLQTHLTTLQNLAEKTDKPNEQFFNPNNMFADQVTKLIKNLITLEQATGIRPSQRTKRAIIPFGSKIMKFLYGTLNVDDGIN